MVRNANGAPTARELVEYYVANGRATRKRRRGRPTREEEAVSFGLEQYNPLVIRAAFQGVKPPDESSDREWGVYRLIRELIDIAGDHEVDDKGKLRVTTTARLQAMKELRQYHALLVCSDDGFIEASGRKPQSAIPGWPPREDPIVAMLKRGEKAEAAAEGR